MTTEVERLTVQLENVETAINKTLLAQEYSLDTGQSKQFAKRANLAELYNYQSRLQGELQLAIAKATRTNIAQGVVSRDTLRDGWRRC